VCAAALSILLPLSPSPSPPTLYISPILIHPPQLPPLTRFFATLYYHTLYAVPWIFPPFAFYGADFLVRFLRLRVVVGRVV
jgi:hypothetical protein